METGKVKRNNITIAREQYNVKTCSHCGAKFKIVIKKGGFADIIWLDEQQEVKNKTEEQKKEEWHFL